MASAFENVQIADILVQLQLYFFCVKVLTKTFIPRQIFP